MTALLAALLAAASPQQTCCCCPCPTGSYLYQPSFCMDHALREPVRHYQLQPGDIFLATDRGFIAKMGHRIAGTGAPQHSGVIVARSDGRIAILEGGPFNTLRCRLVDDAPAHMAKYAAKERVWIRARKIPLTCEQSRRLTAFAEEVDGTRFAVGRLFGQLSLFRSRGPMRTEVMGKAASRYFEPCSNGQGMRSSYFCSELVTEALVAARAVDPGTARPAATYPRDLFFGRSVNPWLDDHLRLCEWEAPARWVPCPGAIGTPRVRPWMDGDGPGPAGGSACAGVP